MKRAELLALFHDTVPAEVTDPEGMVESCDELQYV
jgi:hypothetical protein